MKQKVIKTLKIFSYVFLFVLVTVASFSLVKNLVFSPVVVSGNSMNPTLKDGEFGYVNKTSDAIKNIKRNQIIIFKSNKRNSLLVKRVVGLPNETLFFTLDGRLYIDDQEIPQSYIDREIIKKTTSNGLFVNEKIKLGDNEFFVLGDNRGNSFDSMHGLGFVKKEEIQGVLKTIVAKCNEGSYNNSSSSVCNSSQRNYYWIADWRYF